MSPTFTDYTRRVSYTTHDVTKLVLPGENVIGVEVGTGYWADPVATPLVSGAEWAHTAVPQLMAELHMSYTDGSSEVIASDPSWTTTAGPRLFDSVYLGETFDGTRAAELAGWTAPGYDAVGWAPAVVAVPPTGTLQAEAIEPFRVVERRRFVNRSEPADGVFVFDLGQMVSGRAVLDVAGAVGDEVELLYGESLDEAGRVVPVGVAFGPPAEQRDVYRLAPGGRTWHPRFSYKGFRYLEVTGWPEVGGPSFDAVRAEIIRTAARRHGTFSSSHALLNQLYRNTVWSVANNMHGMPTDTPVFEKVGWTGDGHIVQPVWMYTFDTRRFHRKWYRDMLDGQGASGHVGWWAPWTLPEQATTHIAWDSAIHNVPWQALFHHGDERLVRDGYSAMKRYWELIEWLADGDLFTTSDFADWAAPPGEADQASGGPLGPWTLQSTALYWWLTQRLAQTASLLGETAEADAFAARADQIAQTFHAEFFDSGTGVYAESSDTAFSDYHNVLPLGIGLVPAQFQQQIAAALAKDITDRDLHQGTGVVGSRFLYPALADYGFEDLAFRLLTQTTFPSYGYWVSELGATSLFERWDEASRSRNHHMQGSFAQYLYEDLAGFEATAPGFAEIEFRPMPPEGGLDWVAASTDTVRGRVATMWRKAGDRFFLDVTVPPNATGLVHVPAPDAGAVAEIGRGLALPAQRADGVELVGAEDGRIVYRVSSGTYRFRVGTTGGGGGPLSACDPAFVPDADLGDVAGNTRSQHQLHRLVSHDHVEGRCGWGRPSRLRPG